MTPRRSFRTERSAASSRTAGSRSIRGTRHGPAGERGPAPRRLLPRLPQPPGHGDRPGDPPPELTEEVKVERRRALRHPPRRVRPRAHAWSGSSCPTTSSPASRARSPRATRADRPRHGRLLRPGLEGDADARAREPRPGSRSCLRPGLPIAQLSFMTLDSRPSGPTATRSSAATTTGQVEATESRYEPVPTGDGPATPTKLLQRGTPVGSRRDAAGALRIACSRTRSRAHLRRHRDARRRRRALRRCARGGPDHRDAR